MAVLVFLVLAAAGVAAYAITRNLVRDNERRLLEERAGEVGALLQNTVGGSNATLAVLAVLAASPDRGGFEQGARTLARTPGSTVSALGERDGGFVVTSAVGAAPTPDRAVAGPRAAAAARALAERQPVLELIQEDPLPKLVSAVAAPAPARVVAMLDYPIDPTRPVASVPGSPFGEIRGALYASPVPDPSRLVLTTETVLPVRGRVVQVPFAVGAEQWTLVVGTRTPLTGSFPGNAPWLLLGAGLVAALLASTVVQTLTHRHEFVTALVEDRTRELESTRGFLERLLVSAPTVVMRADLSDPSRRLSYISPNVERIFGLHPDVLVAEGSFWERLHPDDLAMGLAAGQRLREGASVSEVVEFRLRHGDGTYRWVSSIALPEVDEQGEALGVLVYLTDVSKRREAEDALRVAQRAAEDANRSKSEFLSRMSHELRTPLNAVLGFGQLLEMQQLNDDQADAVDQILKGGRHLLDLIDEVLDISRIETGRLLLSPEPVLVADLVRESLDLVRTLAERREVTLVTDESGMFNYAFADRQRAKQVMLNLLSNAVKYNRFGGAVAVSCGEVDGTRLRISVADTGPGIHPEQMGRLFTPFDRLDAGQSEVEGTGIGLTLSKSLAEVMGGALVVESIVGQGSTFAIELPRVEGPVERYERLRSEPDRGAEPTVPGGERSNGRRVRTVLHIEDNPSNLKLIERILAQRDDIVVVSAMQGRLGVELARQHHPTLILLDLHLPDVNGEQILKRLREDPVTQSIPVIMVSADATPGQVQRLLAAGATAYLTKPLDVAKLLRVVDNALAVR